LPAHARLDTVLARHYYNISGGLFAMAPLS